MSFIRNLVVAMLLGTFLATCVFVGTWLAVWFIAVASPQLAAMLGLT